jgi:multiple sugar transport system substrate-binding protein
MDLAKKMTRPDQGVFGFNYMGGAGPVTLAPIALADGLSEFGWDGENYHMAGPWAEAINFTAEARRLQYQALQGTEAWGAVSGDPNMWPGESGRVAFQMDAWWTLNNIYTKASAIERGIDMIPYVQPRGATAKTNRKDAAVDYAAISSGTKHPREAYEALKFLTWSKEGWTERIKLFPTLVNEAGTRIYDVPNCFPLLNDDALYAEFRKLFDPLCVGDSVKAQAYDEFMKYSSEPVPLGGQGILGFDLWLSEVYFGQDWNGVTNVEEAVFQGAINANDAVPELEKTGREYYLRALNEFNAIYP